MKTLTTTVLLAVLALPVAPANEAPAGKSTDPLGPAEFQRQWKAVRAEYPLVAEALLESYQALAEAGVVRAKADVPPIEWARVVRPRLCIVVGIECPEPAASPEFPCRQCRPASGPDDIERHANCLGERLACLLR